MVRLPPKISPRSPDNLNSLFGGPCRRNLHCFTDFRNRQFRSPFEDAMKMFAFSDSIASDERRLSMTQVHSAVQSTCPICQSREIHSTGFHGIVERILLWILRIRPLWCNDCFSRFYLFFPQSELCPQESRGGTPALNSPNAIH